jgi:hypothetical protein
MNWNGPERGSSWHDRDYPGIFLEGPTKTTTNAAGVASVPAGIRIQHLPHISQECCPYTKCLGILLPNYTAPLFQTIVLLTLSAVRHVADFETAPRPSLGPSPSRAPATSQVHSLSLPMWRMPCQHGVKCLSYIHNLDCPAIPPPPVTAPQQPTRTLREDIPLQHAHVMRTRHGFAAN